MLTELRAAAWTVMLAEPETPFSVAVTLVLPAVRVLTKPLLGDELLTVATAGAETLQWADAVTSCCVPSLNVAVAANCWFCPAASVAEAGLTLIAVTTAVVPVTVTAAVTLPLVALMTAEPAEATVTLPVELTEATDGLALLQTTAVFSMCELPSEKVPVAVSCWLDPAGRLGLAGVMAIELNVALLIVTGILVDIDPSVAPAMADPLPTAVRLPLALMVATAGLEVV
jgi:hypothetical protein